MSPVLLYNLVISLIVTFQYFTQAYTLTNGRGDPNNATLFINLELYREAFVFNQMGYGAAIAWLLFAIVLVLTLALFAFARKRVYYAGERSMTTVAETRRHARSRDRGPIARAYRRYLGQGVAVHVRDDPRQRVPAAAAVHGHDGVPAARPDLDARRAGLSGVAADRAPTRARSTRSTRSRSTATTATADARHARAASRARSSTRPIRRRRRSSGRATGGR